MMEIIVHVICYIGWEIVAFFYSFRSSNLDFVYTFYHICIKIHGDIEYSN